MHCQLITDAVVLNCVLKKRVLKTVLFCVVTQILEEMNQFE